MLVREEADSKNANQKEYLPSKNTDCIFCKQSVPEKLVIFEDERFIVSHRLDSQGPSSYLGLVLIQTKRHVNDLGELDEAEASELGTLIQKVGKALKTVTGAAWAYCYCFMEGARHVHVFVTSRYPNVPQEYVRLNIGNWPEAPLGELKQVEELSSQLRSLLSREA